MRQMMADDLDIAPSRQVRFFGSFEEQETENIRYWNSKSAEEKLQGTTDIILRSGRVRKIDGPSAGPTRSLVRVPCSWS